MPKINKTVLMSGAEFFTDDDAINYLMDDSVPVDVQAAIKEHNSIRQAFAEAGIKVTKCDAPKGLQDGIYVANWALVRGKKALMSRLPNKRKPEEAYAKQVLQKLGLEILELPDYVKSYSGQGDTLVCDNTVFCQSPYRTSPDSHRFIKDWLGYGEIIELQTKPARWFKVGPAKRNKLTGWPDSPTYDIDLAVAIIRPATDKSKPVIAYCPDVFKRSSRKIMADLKGFDKIQVSKSEAMGAFALNLVSTGETVIMSTGAPNFKSELEARGLKTIELSLVELKKGGGSIRCSSLTLD